MRYSAKIAIFLPSLRGGGAERAMAKLASGFTRRGYPVHMVLARAEGPYLNDLSSDIRVIDLGKSRVATALPGLIGYLRRERPAALLSALSHANVIALLARRMSGTAARLIVTERNSTTCPTWTDADLKSKSLRVLMKHTYPWADSIVTVSKDMIDGMVRELAIEPSRVIPIHNPVVTSRLLFDATRTTTHPWLGERMPPVILAVGRLTEQKDFPTLLRAMAALRRQGRTERLIILGEGEERHALETLVKDLSLTDCVDLPGFAANPYAFMSRAALFVVSSKYEGLPNVLIEAMACGAPVVSTDCPSGPAEILENGRWGTLVPPGNSETLARAMIDALDNPHKPDVRRRAADFSEDKAVARYLEVLGIEPVNGKLKAGYG